eukprot:TRINITY_DN5172_c0_g1_i2.p1 TRINITY_DN5172_c0_g1~~TRINITY_DN5172_c0_g1_i2.p1  ORF type:complete len:631 (+),score=189.97 TRINITY_DN5172_c0_g1_i2:875-2767(+)
MQYTTEAMNRYLRSRPEARNPGEKDGALRIIGSLSGILMENPEFCNSLEEMLVLHVIPELSSKHAFLRARATWVISKFARITFTQEITFLNCVQQILNLMADTSETIPVRIYAAVSLKDLIKPKFVREKLEPSLPNVLDTFLKLMEGVDCDDLIASLEVVVKKFRKSVSQYAPTLIEKMVIYYHKITQDTKDFDDYDNPGFLAAQQTLSAIITVLHCVQDNPKVLAQVDPIISHLLLTLRPELDELLTEYIVITAIMSFYSESISDNLWLMFDKLCDIYVEFGGGFLDELLGPLDNFVSRSTDKFLSNPRYQQRLCSIYQRLLEDSSSEERECGDAAQLMEVIFVYCKGRVDDIVPTAIGLAIERFHTSQSHALRVLLLGVVANGFYYNPLITLNLLESREWTSEIFKEWLEMIPELPRLHDMKLSILALCTLFHLSPSQWPASLQQRAKDILLAIMDTIQRFNEKNTAQEAESDETDTTNSDDSDEEDMFNRKDVPDDKDVGDDDDDEDIADDDEAAKLLKKIKAKHYADGEDVESTTAAESFFSQAFALDDEDLEENYTLDDDDDFTSLIDEVDEVVFFLESLEVLSNKDRAAHHFLLSSLSAQEEARFKQLVAEGVNRKTKKIEEQK